MKDSLKTREQLLNDLAAMRQRVAESEASRAEFDSALALLREGEERLRLRAESNRLASTNQLAAQIAHDINNPLASIRGCVALIKRAIPEDHPRYEFVELVDSEVDRISRTLRQMFDLYRSKWQAIVQIDVADAVGDALRLLEDVCRERLLNLERLSDGSTLIVSSPDSSLRQLFYSLVASAVKASPSGGTITISATRVGGNARITIADQGEGIPAGLHDRVFGEPFTTTGDGSSDEFGVGLAISREIAEVLRGSMDFTSEPGKGTVFTVLLPLMTREADPE